MQPRIHVTAADIGRVLYPVDNSFVYNISEKKEDGTVYLAGHNFNEGKPSEPVLIVSGNYKRSVKFLGKTDSVDSVTVAYSGKLYCVPNVFTEDVIENKPISIR